MVEAFSLRGLGRLAERWKEAPPFPGDNAYGDAIAGYCRDIIQRYTKLATEQGLLNDPAAWVCKPHRRDRFARAELICAGGVTTILAEYERAPNCVEVLAALNRETYAFARRSPILEDQAKQEMHVAAVGSAVRRFGSIGSPHLAQVPYVPSDIRFRAASI